MAQLHAQTETHETQDADQESLEGPPPAEEHLIHRQKGRTLCRKRNPLGTRRPTSRGPGARVKQQRPPV